MKKIELDNDGRVKIDNQVMALLKAIPDGNYYKEKIIKDKNLLGFRARANPGGQRSFVYRYRPKGKDENGNYFEKVNDAQTKLFGNSYVNNSSKNIKILPMLSGDLNKCSLTAVGISIIFTFGTLSFQKRSNLS